MCHCFAEAVRRDAQIHCFCEAVAPARGGCCFGQAGKRICPSVSRLVPINRFAPIAARWTALVLAACIAAGGCALRSPRAELAASAKNPPAPASPPGHLTMAVKPAEPPVATTDRGVLARNEWARAVPFGGSPYVDPGKPPGRETFRWRHPGLDSLLARPAASGVDLHPFLADSDPVVATNAAIGLARSGDDRSAPRLAAAVRAVDQPLPLRCAAAESLALLPGPAALKSLQDLTDEFCDLGPGAATVYQPALHAELVHGLARHVEAADDPRLLAALQSPAVEVRAETLRAWAAGHRGMLPADAVQLRCDGDARVRAAALAALAARHHAQARQYMTDALRDCDLQVRVAAIAALGELGGGEAIAALGNLLKDRSDRMRGEAVTALAHAGAKQSVLGTAGDTSWRVRIKVAEALAGYPDRDGAAVARTLLDDPSVEVERRVLASVAAWPLELAGPIFLEAMGKTALVTRKAAAEELAQRWPAASDFSSDSLPERRAESLQQLKARFGREFGLVDPVTLASHAEKTSAPQSRTTTDAAGRVEQLLRAEDMKGLAEFGPDLVAALELLAVDRHQGLPEAVYHDVLPHYGAVFVALERLRSPDVLERRRAAEELAAATQKQPLGRLAVMRLSGLIPSESDPLVWQNVLDAVAADPSEPADRIACAALGDHAAEVRRRACEHMAVHPAAAHAKLIVPLLTDANRAVVLAAIRALGAIDPPGDLQPLRQMLAVSDEEVQLETALALGRLHDRAAVAAFDRLAYSDDPKTRVRVAQTLGELGDASCTATLVRLLDDRRASVSRAALMSLPKVVGQDVGQPADAPQTGPTEQIRRWKQWFAEKPPERTAGR